MLNKIYVLLRFTVLFKDNSVYNICIIDKNKNFASFQFTVLTFLCTVITLIKIYFWYTLRRFFFKYPVVDSKLILGYCKILQSKFKYNEVSQMKSILLKIWPKLYRNDDFIALVWVTKLSDQRASFQKLKKNIYSMLHDGIKTLIESFIGFAFVQYIHRTFSSHLEDKNLFFNYAESG